MFRLSGIFFMAIAVACASLLFWTSQSVQRAEEKLADISQYKYGEEETLRVLTAEWDYLNRPERLEKLTLENLDMDESHAQDEDFVAAVNEIPEPIAPIIPRTKPANLFQYVSAPQNALNAVEPAAQNPVIEKTEQDNFSALLDDVTSGGQE